MSSPSRSTTRFSRVRRSLIHLASRSRGRLFPFFPRLVPLDDRSWMNVSACTCTLTGCFWREASTIRRCVRERWYRFVACTRTCVEPPWKDKKGASLSAHPMEPATIRASPSPTKTKWPFAIERSLWASERIRTILFKKLVIPWI